jgi:hypothetical protein
MPGAERSKAMKTKVATIIRSKGGSEERVVKVEDIRIPAVRELAERQAFSPDKTAILQTHKTCVRLLKALKGGNAPTIAPESSGIPDLWFVALRQVDKADKDTVLELWHLTHDLRMAVVGR